MTKVLIVDDSEDDRLLIRRILCRSKDAFTVFDVDAAAARNYLSGNGKFSDRASYPLPELILCDIRMPESDGYALLGFVQSHPTLKRLPVALMSGIATSGMREQALQKGACAFADKGEIVHKTAPLIQAIRAAL